MHGNRDFLLGEGFMRATGCRLLPDPTVIDLYDEKVLVMHGDTLCTDDVDYQRFRRMVRDPDWIAQFIAKPLAERIAMAQDLRETSKTATAAKKPEIMDVNPGAVEAVMHAHRVRHLIHGHTHRPAQHELVLDGAPARRTVLGDWYEQGSVLACTPQQCVLERLD
jgi:UDP-2,3-diacylglucosamine hydrolase